jgi:hypothetical protein
MSDWHKVNVKVVSQKGQYEGGHKVEMSSLSRIRRYLVFVRGFSRLFSLLSRHCSPAVISHGKQIRIQQPSLAPTLPIPSCLNWNECNKCNSSFNNFAENIKSTSILLYKRRRNQHVTPNGNKGSTFFVLRVFELV